MLCVAALNITSLIASTGLSETLLAILILYLFNGTYHLILYIQVAVANTISSFKCAAIGQSANMTSGSENATTSIPKDKQYATEGFLFDRSPIDVSSWIGLCTVFAFLAATGVLYVNRLAKGDDDVLMLIAPAPAKDDSEPEDAYGFGDVCPSRAKHEHFCVSWPAVKEASWKTSSGVNIDLEAFSCPELERASSSSADSRPQAESIVYILAARCAAVLSKTAIRSRYVPGVESRMLPSSLSSCSDLAKTVTAPCDDHSPRRRVFGLDLPPIRPPLAFSLEDLETDDGGYLRTALGMMDDGCEGGAAGFWPEIDQYVPRGEDGKCQAWYTDEDVMRGWHFPGREAVPEFGFHEDGRSSDDSSKSEMSGEWLVPDEEIIGVLIKAGVVTMGELGGGMEAEVVVEDKA